MTVENRKGTLIALALVLAQASTLAWFGRPWICACGEVWLWVGRVASPQNSQMLADWYTFSHLLHGFLFYGAMRVAAPRVPLAYAFAMAVGVEAAWEILENSTIIIERYRQNALAQGYVGDSILNSVSDTLAMALGFGIASRLRAWQTLALFIATELALAWFIRDGLILNVIQLVWPSAAISAWQSGG